MRLIRTRIDIYQDDEYETHGLWEPKFSVTDDKFADIAFKCRHGKSVRLRIPRDDIENFVLELESLFPDD